MGKFLSVAVAFLLALPAAQAEEFTVGAWAGDSYDFEGTGEFSHCTIWAEYDVGELLFFSITRDGQIVIGLHNSNWTLKTGDTYPVTLRVDRRPIGRYQAEAFGDMSVGIRLPYSEDTVTLLRKGYVLHIDTITGTLSYRLTGTSAALPRLQNCVYRHLFKGRTAANPFSGGAGVASRNPFGRDSRGSGSSSSSNEAVVSDMLELAGLQGFRFVKKSERADFLDEAPYAWSNGKVFGAMYGFRKEDFEVGLLASVYIGAIEDGCDGKFTYGMQSVNFSNGSPARRAIAECKMTGSKIITTFAFFEIEEYFSIIIHFGAARDSEAVQRTDEAIFRVWDNLVSAH